jgi:RNA polymerase primary sigma factor
MEDELSLLDYPLKVYLAEVKKVLPLGHDEEIECLRHIRTGDEWAETSAKRLLEANLQLVVTIANRYADEPAHILDLIQEGNSGLLTAIQTAHNGPDDNFPIHATPFIERAIAKAVSDHDSK